MDPVFGQLLSQGQPGYQGFLVANRDVPQLAAIRLITRRRVNESGDRCQTPRRVRSQLQVNEGGLDPAVAQPPAEVVERNPVVQHMPGKAVPQRMGPDTPALGNLASLRGPEDRLLHPPPDRYSGHIDQPALADCPETGGRHYTAGFRSKYWSTARVNNDGPDPNLYPPILGFKLLPGSPGLVMVPGFTG